jgi:hypothetical protein
MSFGYANSSSFSAMRTGYSTPYGSYGAYAESASQSSAVYGPGGASAAESAYSVRGGFGAVDSYGMAASSYGSAYASGYAMGMGGLGAYAANYYSGYQASSAAYGGYGMAAVQGSFQGAYSSGAISQSQYQQLQGWGQDITGMQSALGAYGGNYSSGVDVGIGSSGGASLDVEGHRYSAGFGADGSAGLGYGTFGSSASRGQGEFRSFGVE